MEYTKIPTTTFQKLQINAGIICTEFEPSTGVATGQIGATTGGAKFSATPSFKDFGDDVDNCPKKTKEMMQIEDWDVALSGSLITVDAATAKMLIAACDIDGTDSNKLVPRNNLKSTDFEDLWLIGDYSDKNENGTNKTAGYVAIKVINALNEGGFQLETADKSKGKFAFNFVGHYSMDAQDTVPFEVYVKAGTVTP